MDNVKDYLKKQLVKDYGYCKQYKTLKACIIGSIDGTITWYDDGKHLSLGEWFRFGLPAKEYYAKYRGSEDFKELCILPPNLTEIQKSTKY